MAYLTRYPITLTNSTFISVKKRKRKKGKVRLDYALNEIHSCCRQAILLGLIGTFSFVRNTLKVQTSAHTSKWIVRIELYDRLTFTETRQQ